MEQLRDSINRQVERLVDSGSAGLGRPVGDPGLFGPGSAAWVVHGDFTTMLIGGVAALLMQMLHPAALAGVWDHSDFRRDMVGRLRRTARFVSGTTYGSTEAAERLIAHVRAIHDRVTGMLPDGTPYRANDPALLTWVHVAEASCFLGAYRRYRDATLPLATQDRYFAEMAVIARALGADAVPETRAAVDEYLQRMRPALAADGRTREVARVLLREPAPTPELRPFGALVLQAGVDVLPGWARAMHKLDRAPPRSLTRFGAHGVGTVMRWALAARNRRAVTG